VGVYPLADMVPRAEVQAWADYAGTPVIAYDVDPALPRPDLGGLVRPGAPGWREIGRQEPAARSAQALRSVAAAR
jgi:hypothetical protein